MLARFLFITLFILSTSPCYSNDFVDLYEGREIAWDITPNDLIQNWSSDIFVLWLGKIHDLSIIPMSDGKIDVSLLFSCHPFTKPCRNAVAEPFKVHQKNSGFFSFTINYSKSVKQVEEEVTKFYKEPYFVIALAKPLKITEVKGKKSILIAPQVMYMSDSYEVEFIK